MEVVGLNYALLPEQRLIDLIVPRQRTGMRHGGLRAGGGPAYFHHDHRLLLLQTDVQRAHELLPVPGILYIAGNDGGMLISGGIFHAVVKLEIHLVSGSHPVAESHLSALGHPQNVRTECAALGNQRDLPRQNIPIVQHCGKGGGDMVRNVHHTKAVGP